METNNSQLVIYQAPDGNMSIDVTVQEDTVWLSQGQMAELFDKDQSVIARHISNVFKEGELEKESNMQILHNTLSKYKPTQVYSLDVIISVGYRVKSKRGTQFRIWANKILKQYLLQGYAINERIAAQKYDELSQLVKVLGRTIQNQERLTEDSRSLLDVVVDYTYALDTLDRYDYQELKIEDTTGRESFHATYENAMEVIRELHEKFGGSTLFGNEKVIPSKAPSVRFTRLSEALTSIPQWRRKPPCSCISLPKTTRSVTATNALPPHCSCGSSTAMAFSTTKTAQSALPTTPSSPLPL